MSRNPYYLNCISKPGLDYIRNYLKRGASHLPKNYKSIRQVANEPKFQDGEVPLHGYGLLEAGFKRVDSAKERERFEKFVAKLERTDAQIKSEVRESLQKLTEKKGAIRASRSTSSLDEEQLYRRRKRIQRAQEKKYECENAVLGYYNPNYDMVHPRFKADLNFGLRKKSKDEVKFARKLKALRQMENEKIENLKLKIIENNKKYEALEEEKMKKRGSLWDASTAKSMKNSVNNNASMTKNSQSDSNFVCNSTSGKKYPASYNVSQIKGRNLFANKSCKSLINLKKIREKGVSFSNNMGRYDAGKNPIKFRQIQPFTSYSPNFSVISVKPQHLVNMGKDPLRVFTNRKIGQIRKIICHPKLINNCSVENYKVNYINQMYRDKIREEKVKKLKMLYGQYYYLAGVKGRNMKGINIQMLSSKAYKNN